MKTSFLNFRGRFQWQTYENKLLFALPPYRYGGKFNMKLTFIVQIPSIFMGWRSFQSFAEFFFARSQFLGKN